MSEPFLERLTRFTPAAGGMDRDALLFAAGRASARPNRGWIALAAVLAGTQLLTLALWWSRPDPPVAQAPTLTAPSAPTPAPVEPTSSESSDDPVLWSAYHGLRAPEIAERPERAFPGRFVESGTPFQPGASRLPLNLN
jgi:hypothetical protein